MDMPMHRCSAASGAKPRKRGTDFGTITLCAHGVAAAAAGSPREGADLHVSKFFCRPARQNGEARGGAAPRRAAAPTLFATSAGARVADTRICRHAARAATPRCQFFTPRVDAGRAAARTAPRPLRGGTGRRRAPARQAGAASGAALPPFARKRA